MHIYLSLSISLSCSTYSASVTFSELFCDEPLETFVISLANLLPIKSPVVSGVERVFEVLLDASVTDYLASLRRRF